MSSNSYSSSSSGGGGGGGAHPLRPYYQPPEDTKVYVSSAPKPAAGSSGSSGRAGAGAGSSAHTSSQSATVTLPQRAATNRYATTNDDLEVAEIGNISDWLQAGAFTLLLQYSSTCMAMPFEVGKLLLQVQWVPKDEVWNNFAVAADAEANSQPRRAPKAKAADVASRDSERQGSEEDEDMAPEAQEWRRASDENHYDDSEEDGDIDDEDDDDSSPSDVEAYFRDSTSSWPSKRPPTRSSKLNKATATDSSGYLVRRSLQAGDAGPRPEFVMPVVVRGGVWEMIKAVARGKEGWAGLWKGTFTSFVYDLLASGVQPVVSAIISPLIPYSLSTLPLPYVPHPSRTLALLVSSHVITHLVLSPLDLIRTRLIVQSTLPRHRKYTGPWDALKKILHEEGGWRAIYGHPHLLIPAFLDLTIRPLISISSPLLIERWLRVEPNSSPASYAFAELFVNSASLFLSLPIETVRRRLQVQRRPSTARKLRWEPKGSMAQTDADSSRSTLTSSLFAVSGNTGTVRGLRTCVETRPRPYTGVVEAIYRILTEETSHIPQPLSRLSAAAHRHRRPSNKSRRSSERQANRPEPAPASASETATDTAPSSPEQSLHPLARSEVLAPQKPTYATLGGVRSLYRGFTMAAGANLLVFFLTVVTGERVSTTGGAGGGWAEI